MPPTPTDEAHVITGAGAVSRVLEDVPNYPFVIPVALKTHTY